MSRSPRFWLLSSAFILAATFLILRNPPEATPGIPASQRNQSAISFQPSSTNIAPINGAPITKQSNSPVQLVFSAATPNDAVIDSAARNPALRPLSFYRQMRTARLNPVLGLPKPLRANEAVNQRWRFELFPGANWTGKVLRTETHNTERATYYGELEGIAGSDFILTNYADAVSASFTIPGQGIFQVRSAGNGLLTLIELDGAKLPSCALNAENALTQLSLDQQIKARQNAALLTRYAADSAPTGISYGALGQAGGSETGLTFTTVDVLITYTSAAQTGAGGASGIVALADLMVARANATFINSRVGLRLRLVKCELATYTETNNINTDLDRLTNTSDGYLDNLHATRTANGADLVCLVTETTGGSASGLAWLYANGSNPAANGFSIVQRAGHESTFVHEIGHNFGCQHDRENTTADTDGSALYPYAFGHRFTPSGYAQMRTVMAYAPGDRVPYFSNPDVTYLGTPTGVAIGQPGEAHNAHVLENTKAALAAFRSAAGNNPPSIALTHPTADTSLSAYAALPLAASATDTDGTVASVRFYQLRSDGDWAYSNLTSILLGTDSTAPYSQNIDHLEAGFITFAAVAEDNLGGISTHTVSVTANPWYKSTTLPLANGYTSGLTLTDINASGQISGYVNNGTLNRAARWDATTITLLDSLSGDSESKAHAIASDGTIYGESINGSTRRACTWSAVGIITDRSSAIPGQTAVAAYGADDSGNILYEVATGRYYRATSVLPLYFDGTRIASNGLVGGYDYNFSASAWQTARWTSGSTSTMLPPLISHTSSRGWAINRAGAVVGISSPTSGWSTATARATYWAANSSTPVDLATSGSTASWASALNDHNDVVGYYKRSGDHPFYWNPTLAAPVPLRSVVMPAQDLDLSYPKAINQIGMIAVETWDYAQGSYVPVRLTPVAGLNHVYWQRGYFTAVQVEGTGVAGDTDDPDNDGYTNLIERAFSLNPNSADYSLTGTGYPSVSYDNATQKLALTFRQQRAPSDLTYTVETCTNLANNSWSSMGATLYSRNALDESWDTVVYESTTTPGPGLPVFMRVKISR